MANPVSADRELARILVEKCDYIISMFYENAVDALGAPGNDTPIDRDDLIHAVDNIQAIQRLRTAIIDGQSGSLFSQHGRALTTVMEMALDMEG